MSTETLAFALAAGTLAAVNPCGFAMLPAYLSLFVVGADKEARPSTVASVGRALTATGSMALGFVAVFGVFGLALTPVASAVQRWLPVVTVVIGVVLLLLGLVLMTGRTVAVHVPFLRLSRDPVASPVTMMLYGASYAIASLGCTIGPFLVVTATTFRAGDAVAGVAGYAVYAIGMGLVVGVLAIGAALMNQTAVGALRRLTPYLSRISGGLLVIAGAYVGWYGWYELRVYAGDTTDDPIVTAASEIQNRLSQGVDQLGPMAFTVAMVVLVVGTLAARAMSARRTARSTRTTPPGGPE